MNHRQRLSLTVASVMLVALAATPWVVGLADNNRSRGNRPAHATLRAIDGSRVGKATLSGAGGDVELQVEVWGLSPGFHGFHVHAIGQCDPATGFTSAGGHFNPDSAHHPHHAADLPALLVGEDGTGSGEFVTDRFRVSDLFDADGSALVIHAGPDNYANIPERYAPAGPDDATLSTGDAGGRAACGVITRNRNAGD